MKLFTESQVYHMLRRARFHNQDDSEMFTNEYLISQVTPIELPSDLEIGDKASCMNIQWQYKQAYLAGAQWLKIQILKQIE